MLCLLLRHAKHNKFNAIQWPMLKTTEGETSTHHQVSVFSSSTKRAIIVY